MKRRFTLEALTHIDGIHFYIEGRSSAAARRIVARIFARADRLGKFPELGHVGVIPGTYEWTIPGLPYIIVHEVDADEGQVVILGVFHGASVR